MRRKHEPIDVFTYIDIPPDGDLTPCWPWNGPINEKDNRPYFTVGGVKWLAYRLVWTLVYGPIPEGEVIRHKTCDNEVCCNPTHLLSGTQSDNENDKYEHERWGFPHSVIHEIMRLHAKGMPQKDIATVVTHAHGVLVNQQRVSDIINGVRRKRQRDMLQ